MEKSRRVRNREMNKKIGSKGRKLTLSVMGVWITKRKATIRILEEIIKLIIYPIE